MVKVTKKSTQSSRSEKNAPTHFRLRQKEYFVVLTDYERKFDITATEGKLLKENLGDFFENCKLHPTEGDVISTFNKIYHGKYTNISKLY